MDTETNAIHFENFSISNDTLTSRKSVIQILDLFNSKYDCKICRKKLRYKSDQIIHSKLKHRPGVESKSCPYCQISFKTYHQLSLHIRIRCKLSHHEKPYGCKICRKKFHSFIYLKRHCSQIHLNNLNGSSDSKAFSSNSSTNSSHSSFSSFSFDSRKLNLFDLIDYDNSQIVLQGQQHADDSPPPTNIRYKKFLNKIKLSENVWNTKVENDIFQQNNSCITKVNIYLKKIQQQI